MVDTRERERERIPMSLGGFSGWVTVKEAAALYRVTPEAIRQRITTNHLPTARCGRTILVRLSDLRLTGRG